MERRALLRWLLFLRTCRLPDVLGDLDLTLKKKGNDYFKSENEISSFFQADGAVVKIGLCRKSNHQIKLSLSKSLIHMPILEISTVLSQKNLFINKQVQKSIL